MTTQSPIAPPTEHAAAFRRVHEVTNTHDATRISGTFDEAFAPDVLIHLPLRPRPDHRDLGRR